MLQKEEIRDNVVLVGLNSPVLKEDSATEESMDELAALVETAGARRWASSFRTGRPRTPARLLARVRWRRYSCTARTPERIW